VNLRTDEEPVLSFTCWHRVFGGWVLGILRLTSSRLLFSPFWFNFGIGAATIDREAIIAETLQPRGWLWWPLKGWRLNIKYGRRVESFVLIGSEQQQLNTLAPLLRAIKQWPTR
jgi:hypothetical protein